MTRKTLRLDQLFTASEIGKALADVTGSADAAQLVRRWKSRGLITPIRPGILAFYWPDVVGPIADQLGVDPESLPTPKPKG